MITKENYIRRRRALAQLAEQDLIIITGTDLVQKSSDETYEFEQDGYFYYLTGITEPGWILVIDEIRGDEFLIATDESSYHNETWEVKATNQDVTDSTGISEIKTKRDGWGYLKRELQNYQSIGTIVPKERYIKSFGMYINPAKVDLVQKLRRMHKDTNLIDIGHHLRRLRTVKDEGEILEIRKAIDITADSLEVVRSKLDQYENEAQVYADLTYGVLNVDSSHGFKPVIAAGANSTVLHYKLNNAPIVKNGFLLVDFGATSGRYTADITRTFSIGEVSKRHKDVWNAVNEAQLANIEEHKPGVTMIDLEAHREKIIGDALVSLGVIKTKLRKNIREYYPHASHHLGVDVHDSCVYDEPLKPGTVVTVEPGIYLPEEGIGVRIEDDLLITEGGYEVMSGHIAKQ